jgi:hypothetical protein
MIWTPCAGDPSGYAPDLDCQSEQSDRHLPAVSAAQGLFAGGSADVVVVLDEAYNEYIPRRACRYDGLAGGVPESGDHADVLQDLRPGRVAHRLCLASAEIADLMNRVRQPFNCNNLALAAARQRLMTT